jgi:hypothetical protein
VPAEAVKTTLPTPQLPALNTGVVALTVKVTVEVIPQIFALLNLMRYRYPDISTVTLESEAVLLFHWLPNLIVLKYQNT